MKRSPKVKRQALKRANGCCEQCRWPAELWVKQYMAEDNLTRARAIAAICELKGWGGLTSLLFVDHKIALALGGADAVENTQVLCHPCHQAKKDLTKIAKCKRVSNRRATFEARMREKAGSDDHETNGRG